MSATEQTLPEIDFTDTINNDPNDERGVCCVCGVVHESWFDLWQCGSCGRLVHEDCTYDTEPSGGWDRSPDVNYSSCFNCIYGDEPWCEELTSRDYWIKENATFHGYIEDEHVCEGASVWDDGDGKGGVDPCDRTDTLWIEGEGWLCPAHRR